MPASAACAPWGSLPPELLALCFSKLSAAVNAEAGPSGLAVADAAALLSALSQSREWRAVAVEEVWVRLRLDSLRDLWCPLLSRLRCRELWLPPIPASLASADRQSAEQAVCALLESPAFQQRSSTCLESLHCVPLAVLGDPAACSGAVFPSLGALTLAGDGPQHGWAAPLGGLQGLRTGFSLSGLRTLEVPAGLLTAACMSGHCAASWLPSGLHRLVQRSEQDVLVGFGSLAPVPEVAACAPRTATLYLDALAAGCGCRHLALHAKWVVLSSHMPTHATALLNAAPPRSAQPTAPLPEPALLAWLAVLGSAMGPSSVSQLHIVCSELSLYCRASGHLIKMPPARWQQAGAVRLVAHGVEANLSWPVPRQPPSVFALTVRKC